MFGRARKPGSRASPFGRRIRDRRVYLEGISMLFTRSPAPQYGACSSQPLPSSGS